MTAPRVQLRLRVGAEQAHYGGGLVDGAYVLKLFGDAATELLIRHDGDEGQHEEDARQRDRAGHQARAAGNSPCGRKKRTAAIRM